MEIKTLNQIVLILPIGISFSWLNHQDDPVVFYGIDLCWGIEYRLRSSIMKLPRNWHIAATTTDFLWVPTLIESVKFGPKPITLFHSSCLHASRDIFVSSSVRLDASYQLICKILLLFFSLYVKDD